MKRIHFDGTGPFSSINTFTTSIRMREAMGLLFPYIPEDIDLEELKIEELIHNEETGQD